MGTRVELRKSYRLVRTFLTKGIGGEGILEAMIPPWKERPNQVLLSRGSAVLGETVFIPPYLTLPYSSTYLYRTVRQPSRSFTCAHLTSMT